MIKQTRSIKRAKRRSQGDIKLTGKILHNFSISKKNRIKYGRIDVISPDKKEKLIQQNLTYGFNELDVYYLNLDMKMDVYQKIRFFMQEFGIPKVKEKVEFDGEKWEFDELLFSAIEELERFLSHHYQQMKTRSYLNDGSIWSKMAVLLPYFRIDKI